LKKFKPEELDAAAWRAAFVKVNQVTAEEVPAGWYSPEEIAMKLGHCREVGIQKCRDLAKAGLVERKDFRVVWGRGVRPKPFYRLIKVAKKD
jgi:hypothetical protein